MMDADTTLQRLKLFQSIHPHTNALQRIQQGLQGEKRECCLLSI
jgi:hypothetical protein